ncbi:MAG: exo-alpha-sialidase [Bacteroidales bacterium]|nr:exo-alpha-sialidase [Bacteroidales bacterium]
MKYSMLLIMGLITFHGNAQKVFTGAQAIVKEEFIFRSRDVPFPSCHASTLAETKKGLIAAWFGGTHEKAPDVGIWVSLYAGGKWSTPGEVANGISNKKTRYPTWNPVLFNTGKKILLFFKAGPSPRQWWGEVISSADQGGHWSEPFRLPEGILGPIKDKPVLLSNGWLLSPSSTEDHGWQVHIELSGDMGKTWTKSPPLNDPEKINLIQPTLLEHPGGKVQMLCRSKNNTVFTAWSQDMGLTWGPFLSTGLPNPNAGIDAVKLKEGKYLLVYNHIACVPGKHWGNRNILNVAVSNDGVHWKAAVLLENDPDKNSEYSYPAVIQTCNGLVHITYTWNRKQIKHVVIDPSKIITRDFDHGTWPVD